MIDTEQTAIRLDAEKRLEELRQVHTALWPDRDDAEVLSELVSLESQIEAAQQALREAA